MKTISVAVSESDYEIFQHAAKASRRSAAQLIRDAMALYRRERLESRGPLHELPVLAGHRAVQGDELPGRAEIHEEMLADRDLEP